ncbi:MAG: cytochrome c biogenesis protein CcsA [Pirellulales bacterium]|nr:cytochrome c biogenesis protein CcsA [Pirellulales bacterium]
MGSGVNMLCFTASYVIALALEFSGLWGRMWWRRLALLGIASAGLVAHTWFLGQRVALAPRAPLASHQDWYLLAAWVLAIVYLATKFYHPKSSMGLFLLPAVLAVVAGAQFASTTPLATFQAPRLWGRIHGVFLMLGTVAVLLGFLAGLMYLIQSYRLKHKTATSQGLKLPSLEWLERTNSRALMAATLLVGGGFFTGVISRLAHTGEENFIPWTDPVVWSLAAMLVWLVVAEMFRLVYPAARQGRKVAYLTMASFVFLLFVLTVILLGDSLHGTAAADLVGGVEP